MLDAGAAEVLQVLLDLALALPLGGLVDRELDLPLPVGHHLRHERGVLGVDLLVGEVDDVREAHRALVELDPVVHPAELHVADHVVDRFQADTGRGPAVRPSDFLKTGEERTGVLVAVHERVDVLAVRRDRRQLDAPEVVLDPVGVDYAARTALHRLAIRLTCVRNGERGVSDAVPVRTGEAIDLAVPPQAARQHEADVALLDQVGGSVAHARLRSRVCGPGEAERVLVVERRLFRVADVELEMIPPVDGHEVRVLTHGLSLLGRWHGDRPPPRCQEDPTRDRHTAHDLHRRNRLRQEGEREQGGEERLQVREQ